MSLFEKNKNASPKQSSEQTQQKKQQEMKVYIRGAGGTIVTKSILNGTSKLKWLFRQESEYGNGWVAFGDTDSQEYVDNPENMAVVDFNTLANIEPAVVNVFYMPVGSDLEFRSDRTGKYFVDTETGKEIREPVKPPAQIAFEKNLKFLNQETYPADFFRMLFTESKKMKVVPAGEVDFTTGEVQMSTGLFSKNGKKRIRKKINIRIISRRFFKRTMRRIRNFRIRPQAFWSGSCRKAGSGRFCFPAVWETAYSADTGGWMRRENPFA